MRELFYGDNLDVLRRFIPSECVDLVYLDPPFNSKRDYNILFREPEGAVSDAQVTAFEDSWTWGPTSEQEFAEVVQGANPLVAEIISSLRRIYQESDLMAYLVMMANRLLEIHRVMKPTASLYLHCDVSASHYIKVILDGVFGPQNFRNEIIWHYYNKYSAGKRLFAKNFDQVFFYSKSDTYTFIPQREKRDTPTQQLIRENVGGVLKNKKGPDGKVIYRTVTDKKVDAVWRIPCLQPASREMLGYPTQKPLALLDRIIRASSSVGDIVLDPFCGCGTAVHAAEKLKRNWIGIDITHLAIGVIENRMRSAFPDIDIRVHGTPVDFQGARNLAERDKMEFQHWACWLIGARSKAARGGGDRGIDGTIFFQDERTGVKKAVVSVKGGQNVGPGMIRDLKGAMAREEAELGFFITLAKPTRQMVAEAASAGVYRPPDQTASFQRLQLLTVEGLLDGSERPEYINVNPALTYKQPPRERVLRAQEEFKFEEEPVERVERKEQKAKVVRMSRRTRAKRAKSRSRAASE